MRKFSAVLSLALVILNSTFGQTKIAETLAGESWIAYQMVHPLHKIDAKSSSAQYKVEIDPDTKEVRSVVAQVDVTTFDSGNSNRDSHAMEVIDAITYPDVMFTSTSITPKGDSLFLTGKLTFHGVTNDVTLAARQQWSSNRLDVNGSFDLSLTAFKIERPSLLMIPVEDKLSFTFNVALAWK